MNHDEALAIQQRAMRDWIRMMGSSSPGAIVDEHSGVTAAVVPVTPKRSIANSVTYTDGESLIDRLEALGRVYEQAGVEAWTVWAPDFDRPTIRALGERGHAFDGEPVAMVLELDSWQAPEIGDLDWDAEGSGETAGPLNDRAYGIEADGIAASLADPPAFVRQYQARIEGQLACVLSTIEHEGEDLGFYFVATESAHRGKGLASRLMAAVLAEARERGLRTSSLQASKLGEPVYRRLGYEPYFRFNMYERRAA